MALSRCNRLGSFMIADRRASPVLQEGRALGAVYVDNATVIGITKEETEHAFENVKAEMRDRGLEYHDVVEP